MVMTVPHKPKAACLQVQLDADSKQAAEVIFSRLGLSASEAVRMFYAYVEMYEALPFDFRVPNEETLAILNRQEDEDEKVYTIPAEEGFLELWVGKE